MADEATAKGGTTQRERAVETVDTAATVTSALGRPDLARELRLVRERLVDPAFTVLVIGEFKQGKSSLVNALLGIDVCPVDDDIATAVPTVLRYAEEWSAAVFVDPDAGDTVPEDLRVEIPYEDVQAYVTEAGNPENTKKVRIVEIGIPSPLLQGGLVLVDTPGVGGLGSAHSAITVNALPMADAVLFVSDASQEYSGPELEFLAIARRMCPHVFGAMTKCDFYPEWRKIHDLDRGHLAAGALDFRIFTMSSELRRLAVKLQDASLNEESGFPELERHLTDDIVANGERIVLDGVGAVATRVVDELETQYTGERDSLSDEKLRKKRMKELQDAETRAAALLQGSARWETTLADGITDLNRDATHDLDTRLRGFYVESDEAVEAIDPADAREEYEQWLYRRAAEHVAANDEFVRTRVAELMQRVEAHFVEDGGGSSSLGIDIDVGSLTSALTRTGEVQSNEHETDKVGSALAGLRGSYGGLMMFGILGRFVGLALVNPVSLVFGGLLAVRTVRDLRKQSLNQRRHVTKVDGQKYIGDLAIASRKDNIDRLERIRRQLRDRYQQRGREYQESLRTAYSQAKADHERSDEERARRLLDVEAELRRIGKLRELVAEAFA